MDQTSADALWGRAAARLEVACGWSLSLRGRLGQPHADRVIWLADGAPGTVVIKAITNPFASDRSVWMTGALSTLAARGYPVPALLWQGSLDDHWLTVWQRLPGTPLSTLDRSALNALLELVELQAAPGLGPGGWDVSWWIGAVVFDGWEHWWDRTQAAVPRTSQRLRAFVAPAWGHRLPATDVVHHNLNLPNVLTDRGAITGVVDWDDAGVGSRATDLAALLFDWYRLRLAGEETLAADGAKRLVSQILAIAGDRGLRCTVTYAAIARLGLTAKRDDRDELQTWRRVTDAVLDDLA